jgi:hypothetical protein
MISADRRNGGPGADDNTTGSGTLSAGRSRRAVVQTDPAYERKMQGAACWVRATLGGHPAQEGAVRYGSRGKQVRGPHRRTTTEAHNGRVYRAPAELIEE